MFARQRHRVVLGVAIAATAALAMMLIGPGGSSASTLSVGKVQLVASNGKAVQIVNGALGTVSLPRGTPVQAQEKVDYFPPEVYQWPVLTSLPQSLQLAISSITFTCTTCTPNGQNGFHSLTAIVFDGADKGCNVAAPALGDPNVLAVLVASQNQPTVEFTFPSPRTAPIDFSATAPWCIGAVLSGPSDETGFITINGVTM